MVGEKYLISRKLRLNALPVEAQLTDPGDGSVTQEAKNEKFLEAVSTEGYLDAFTTAIVCDYGTPVTEDLLSEVRVKSAKLGGDSANPTQTVNLEWYMVMSTKEIAEVVQSKNEATPVEDMGSNCIAKFTVLDGTLGDGIGWEGPIDPLFPTRYVQPAVNIEKAGTYAFTVGLKFDLPEGNTAETLLQNAPFLEVLKKSFALYFQGGIAASMIDITAITGEAWEEIKSSASSAFSSSMSLMETGAEKRAMRTLTVNFQVKANTAHAAAAVNTAVNAPDAIDNLTSAIKNGISGAESGVVPAGVVFVEALTAPEGGNLQDVVIRDTIQSQGTYAMLTKLELVLPEGVETPASHGADFMVEEMDPSFVLALRDGLATFYGGGVEVS